MISFFRRALSSWIVLGLFGLIMIAFIITGVGTPSGLGELGGGVGASNVAKVGGEPITDTEVTDQVNRQLDRARQQEPDLDMATFIAGGGLQDIIRQLISATALTVFGHDEGFAVSKRQVDGEIASIPAFQNLAGQFDENTFRAALQRERISEKQLREDIAAEIIRRQLLVPVAASAKVPQDIALRYASLLLESRSGSIGLVPAQAMGGGKEPTDAEIAAYYKDNQARYTIPERRVLRYAPFGAESVADAAKPTEAEIAAFYKANADTYGPKQNRTLSQVVLPTEAAAKAFAAKLAAGTSFADAAKQAGFSASDISIGDQTKAKFAEMTSPAIANAAFSAAEGATTPPLQSDFGWHIVKVDKIKDVPGKPLSAVHDEIAKQIGAQKTQEKLADLATKMEDAIADGSTFDEVVKANDLTAHETPPVTATGQVPESPQAQVAPDVPPLLKTAFDMSPDDDPLVETIVPNQRFALIQVSRIVPAAPPPLARIKDQVKSDLVAKRAADRAKAVASAIAAKVNAGTPMAQAFAEADVKLPAPQEVTARRLDLAQQSQQVPPPLAMMFGLPKGKARLVPAPNGAGWFVVHLDTIVPGDASKEPALIQAVKNQFARVTGEEYADQFTSAIKSQLKIKTNESEIARVKSQLLGTGAQ